MELGGGGGGGFWDLSSAVNPAPPFLPFNQHETMVIHGGLQGMPPMDPHLTCLKLGKRHYFEDAGDRPHPSVDHLLGGKKGKGFGGGSSSSPATAAGPVPRCQVEGCSMVLVHAKDYHRRHKVCEMHSKAPKVVVLGLEQRFCQQCSRFHVVSEFDDTKRSCRRRLAGHNERRRKGSNESMGKINPPQDHRAAGGRYQCMHSSPEGAGALSLLSSTSYASDLSRRSSAALRELIAENRAAVLAGQLFSGQPTCPYSPFSTSQVPDQAPLWSSHFQEHVTLDLMQTPASSSYPPFVPGGRRRAKDDDECCDLWKSLEGAHVDIC